MPKKIKLCALCGENDVIGTRDHLPPKAIFTDPKPINLITVPACQDCNNKGSKDDEIFKTFLPFILGHSISTEAIFKSAIKTAKRKFSRYILNTMKFIYLKSPLGIIYDRAYSIPLSPKITDALESVIKRITTGLYYYHFKRFIGVNTVFEVRFHNIFNSKTLGVKLAINKIGNGQFTYGYAKANENDKCISIWVFEFYERYWISCVTHFEKSINSK